MNLFLLVLGLVFLGSPQALPPECPNLKVDLIQGTLNGLEPAAPRAKIQAELPCYTGETADGASYNYGGGVFYLQHDFYFYTFCKVINIRRNFKGEIYPDVLHKSRSEVQALLGAPLPEGQKFHLAPKRTYVPYQLNQAQSLYYRHALGFLELRFEEDQLIEILIVHSPKDAAKS